jgi:PHD-finger
VIAPKEDEIFEFKDSSLCLMQSKVAAGLYDLELEAKPCAICSEAAPGDDASPPVLVCDRCDRAFHLQCVGLSQVPDDLFWHCSVCWGEVKN